MKIQVRFRALEPSPALRAHVMRRVLFHLDRYGHELTSVFLRISDVNGPKGGPDKRCQVTAEGRRLPRITIEAFSEDAYAAVATAVDRAGHAVGRGLARVREVRQVRRVGVARRGRPSAPPPGPQPPPAPRPPPPGLPALPPAEES